MFGSSGECSQAWSMCHLRSVSFVCMFDPLWNRLVSDGGNITGGKHICHRRGPLLHIPHNSSQHAASTHVTSGMSWRYMATWEYLRTRCKTAVNLQGLCTTVTTSGVVFSLVHEGKEEIIKCHLSTLQVYILLSIHGWQFKSLSWVETSDWRVPD